MRPDPISNYRLIRDRQERDIAEAALERAAGQPADESRPRPPRGPLFSLRRALHLTGPGPIWSQAAARR
jgi:hypothetical protein